MDSKEIIAAFSNMFSVSCDCDCDTCKVSREHARMAISALSTIDPEAIRREAGQAAYDHAAVFQRRLASAQEALIKYPAIVTRLVRGYGIDVNEKQIGAYLDDQLSAILSAEPAQDDRNYSEDSPFENGNYECRCITCGATFFGHKRRVQCKVCANKPAQDDGQDRESYTDDQDRESYVAQDDEKPKVGDLIAYESPDPDDDGQMLVAISPAVFKGRKTVVLMRAAEVKRRLEEEKE